MPQATPLPGVPGLPLVRRLSPLALQTDLSPADWLVESLTDFAASVTSVVPRGFESYVGIFHPAHTHDLRPMPWAEIAATNQTHAHAGMQFGAIAGDLRFEHDWPGGSTPDEGSLPHTLICPLLETLSRHTATTERCWFAVWPGWGGLRRSSDTLRPSVLRTGSTSSRAPSSVRWRTSASLTSPRTSGGLTITRGASPRKSTSRPPT